MSNSHENAANMFRRPEMMSWTRCQNPERTYHFPDVCQFARDSILHVYIMLTTDRSSIMIVLFSYLRGWRPNPIYAREAQRVLCGENLGPDGSHIPLDLRINLRILISNLYWLQVTCL